MRAIRFVRNAVRVTETGYLRARGCSETADNNMQWSVEFGKREFGRRKTRSDFPVLFVIFLISIDEKNHNVNVRNSDSERSENVGN